MRAAVALVLIGVTAGCSKKAPVPPPPPPPQVRTATPATTPPAKARTSPQPAAAPKPAKPESATPPAPAARTTAPVLGEIIRPESQAEIERFVQASLDRAQQNIARLHQRSPSPEQLRGIAQVEVFIRQAQDARRTNDLSNARSLAERADVLSQDLLRAR